MDTFRIFYLLFYSFLFACNTVALVMHIATSDLCSTSDITYTQLFSAGGKDPEEWSKKYRIPESMNKQLSEIHQTRNALTRPKAHTRMHLTEVATCSYKLSYKETIPDALQARCRNHQRNVTWFNPAYSKNVEMKVGICHLSLVDQHFPKSNALYKIFTQWEHFKTEL